MAYSKHVYITPVTTILRLIAGELVSVQVPYLAGLPHDPSSPDDPYHWDVVYNEGGMANGVHDSCIVGVYTEEDNHAILQADPDIIFVE